MKRLFLLLTLSTLLFTTGCSVIPKYRVMIDAITAPNIGLTPTTYTIKALDKEKDTQGLVFQQHSQILDNILKQKGYTPVVSEDLAKQFIYFDYGLEKVNEETETYTEPDISFHMGYGYGYGGYYSPFYNPYYGTGFGGYSTYSTTHIYYNRYVTLLAKDTSNKELWRVDVSSIGESKDLRRIIPILIKAAEPYLGVNTAEPIQLVIKDKPKK